MHYRSGDYFPRLPYPDGLLIIEQIRSAKYLGFTIFDNLEWGQHYRSGDYFPKLPYPYGLLIIQQTLEQVRSVKYLGLTITDNMEWGQHVSEISCKATKTFSFCQRNLALAPRHTKEVAYKTLVRPQLEYAAPIWHPYNDTERNKVKKWQRTAARWACRRWRNKSSVDDILDEPWRTTELLVCCLAHRGPTDVFL